MASVKFGNNLPASGKEFVQKRWNGFRLGVPDLVEAYANGKIEIEVSIDPNYGSFVFYRTPCVDFLAELTTAGTVVEANRPDEPCRSYQPVMLVEPPKFMQGVKDIIPSQVWFEGDDFVPVGLGEEFDFVDHRPAPFEKFLFASGDWEGRGSSVGTWVDAQRESATKVIKRGAHEIDGLSAVDRNFVGDARVISDFVIKPTSLWVGLSPDRVWLGIEEELYLRRN